MRYVVLSFATALFLSLIGVNFCAQAGWGGLIKGALKGHADDVARGGSHSIDELAGRGFTEADDLLRRSGLHALDDFRTAIDDLSRYTEPGRYADDLTKLKEAVKLYSTNPSDFDRALPLSEKFPYLQIRSHRSGIYDSAIRSFARARYEEKLVERFDVSDMKVVALGMADDATKSTSEVARFKRHVGRNVLDEVGPLSDLSSTAYASAKAKVDALAPYRGKTVIVVGHIPDDLGDFFVFNSAGRTKVNIGDWMDAANEAGVNLIPLGCHSERLAQLGAKGAINSGTVLERLRLILAEKPQTIGDFFGKLTSDDLVLLIDPLDFRLHSNAVQIISREKNEFIGRIIFNGGRSGSQIFRSQPEPIILGDHAYDECFTSESSGAFTQCVADVHEAAQRERARIIAINQAQEREEQRHTLPSELSAAEKMASSKSQAKMAANMLYLLIWPTASFLFFHGITSARWIEQETGASWQAVFSRTAIRFGLSTVKIVLTNPLRTFTQLLFLLVPLIVGALVFIDPKVLLGDSIVFLWVIGVGLVLFMFLPIVWELTKTAVRERSFASTVAVLAVIGFLGVLYMQLITTAEAERYQGYQTSLKERLNDLAKTAEQDAKLLASLVQDAAVPSSSETLRSSAK
ncbi:hypothetical protein [Rhizobium laguerreae]|uniref:hypothetical protein n=1 Tax=Rhizobium laguerreae TaxID=1076926 RepID=UPI001C92A65C|nr:hypothetical protein [Rhizobium laguerreae]MBY3221776.1 hypothetical protein [Rhizobium laguerreae]